MSYNRLVRVGVALVAATTALTASSMPASAATTVRRATIDTILGFGSYTFHMAGHVVQVEPGNPALSSETGACTAERNDANPVEKVVVTCWVENVNTGAYRSFDTVGTNSATSSRSVGTASLSDDLRFCVEVEVITSTSWATSPPTCALVI